MSEHAEQVRLMTWARQWEDEYPGLDLLFAIPNGGKRHVAVARKLKAEGVKAGVPDLFLPVPRHGYHGLFIELKYGKNRPTPHQWRWLEQLAHQGYKTVVCWGFMDAKAVLIDYLGEGVACGPSA